jgi:hypothetical protein
MLTLAYLSLLIALCTDWNVNLITYSWIVEVGGGSIAVTELLRKTNLANQILIVTPRTTESYFVKITSVFENFA